MTIFSRLWPKNCRVIDLKSHHQEPDWLIKKCHNLFSIIWCATQLDSLWWKYVANYFETVLNLYICLIVFEMYMLYKVYMFLCKCCIYAMHMRICKLLWVDYLEEILSMQISHLINNDLTLHFSRGKRLVQQFLLIEW